MRELPTRPRLRQRPRHPPQPRLRQQPRLPRPPRLRQQPRLLPAPRHTAGTEAPAGAVDLSADCPDSARDPDRLVRRVRARWPVRDDRRRLHRHRRQRCGSRARSSAGGQPTGIDLEIRSGGPAIGFEAPRAQIYTDDSIHIAYSNIDAQMLAWEATPLVAIMAPLEINPQIIMWDPDTYPEIETIADLGEAGRHDQRLRRLRLRRRVRRPGRLVGRPGRPVVRRIAGPLHRVARHRPAGIRLGRAVQLRVRVRGVRQARRPSSC